MCFWLFVGVVSAAGATKEYAGAVAKATGTLSLMVYLAASTLSTKYGAGLTLMFGLPFDRAIKFHRMAGRALVILAGAHMLAVLDYWGSSKVHAFAVDTFVSSCMHVLPGSPLGDHQ